MLRNGKSLSVILPIEMYQELLEPLEDAEDMAWLEIARQTPMRDRRLKEHLAQQKAKSRV
jgi:uncharacterized membrane protein YdbT with pleckstrin-like domain